MQVRVQNASSEAPLLTCGVPRDRSLDQLSLLYYNIYIYTTDRGDILRKHGAQFHFYVDDQQLYTLFTVTSQDYALHCASSHIKACIARNTFMDGSQEVEDQRLQTGFLAIMSAQSGHSLAIPDLHIGEGIILPSKTVRNPGSDLVGEE